MPLIHLGTATLEYTVKKSPRAKHLRISVDLNGVVVTAPVHLPEQEILACVERKKSWIFQKATTMKAAANSLNLRRDYVSGEILPYRGESFTLEIAECPAGRPKVHLCEDRLIVQINRNLPAEERPQEIRQCLERWYKAQAKETFTEIADYYKTGLGVKFNTIRIKDQKTRWGSCSGKGNLNFNWKLVMAPIDIIDYVVVHELCHLVHMNHSGDFWRLVESRLPAYKQSRKWLRDNGLGLRLD